MTFKREWNALTWDEKGLSKRMKRGVGRMPGISEDSFNLNASRPILAVKSQMFRRHC